jgi:hypothetical protein
VRTFLPQEDIYTMLEVCFFFFSIALLCAGTATSHPISTRIPHHSSADLNSTTFHNSTHSLLINSTASNTTTLKITQSPSLLSSRHNNPNEHAWAYFVAKLLAGIAGLVAIMIIVFWVHRRQVRARRRRLGRMMGLGIRRDEILRAHVKKRQGVEFVRAGVKSGAGGLRREEIEAVGGDTKEKRKSWVWKKVDVRRVGDESVV